MPPNYPHKDGLRVCIADTEGGLCAGLPQIVAAAGGQAHVVPADQDLEAFLSAGNCGAVIIGLELPGTPGLERLKMLETRRIYRQLPVLVVSDSPDLEYELPDVLDFLTVPVDQERLVARLQRVMHLRSATVEMQNGGLTESDLQLFQDFLSQHSGLRFDVRNKMMLERGLLRRMRALGIGRYRDYLDYLHACPFRHDELNRLLSLLTVGETCFFRYLNQYDALRRVVLPQLLHLRHAEQTLRFWSAGCSTGEEPYSVAIMLREFFPEIRDWDVAIMAGDINPQSLNKARSGRYRARALRMTDPAMVDKYFHRCDKDYILDESIREMVEFRPLNLQQEGYPDKTAGLADIDVLLCRNVLIYFDQATCRSVIERFYETLRPGGYLFLGHAETLAPFSTGFERINEGLGFYYRRPLAWQTEVAQEPQSAIEASGCGPDAHPWPAKSCETGHDRPFELEAEKEQPAPEKIATADSPSPAELCREAAHALANEEYDTARRIYLQIMEQDPRHCEALTGLGMLCANQGDYEQAREWGARALAVDDLHADAYFLRGLAFEMEEQWPQAREEYRKALLIDLDFVMPHFQLSRIYQRLGRTADARRELQNTLRRLEQLPPGARVAHSGEVSREDFIAICRAMLEQLEGR